LKRPKSRGKTRSSQPGQTDKQTIQTFKYQTAEVSDGKEQESGI